MIGPDSPFIQAMVQKTSDAGFSAPLITQEIAGYLLEHHIDRQLDQVNKGYRLKAEKTAGWVKEHLGEHLEEITGGQAGFYFYLTFKNTLTQEGSSFFKFLSRSTGDPDIDGPKEINPKSHLPAWTVLCPPGRCPCGKRFASASSVLRF